MMLQYRADGVDVMREQSRRWRVRFRCILPWCASVCAGAFDMIG